MPEQADSLMAQVSRLIDPAICDRIARTYEQEEKQHSRSKYIRNLRSTLSTAVRRAQRLGLDQSRDLRILDIGPGIGLFPLVCTHLGHRCETIDIDVEGVYRDMIRYLGIHQTEVPIRPVQPFPVQGPFDLITAFAIAFCIRADGSQWDAPEWAHFLDTALGELAPGGRLALHLNPNYPGNTRHTPEILDLLLRHGALVDGPFVEIRRP